MGREKQDEPKKRKVANNIKELSAQFLGRENNRTSLLTVTACTVSPDLKRATIFITVLPEEKEKDALGFGKKKTRRITGIPEKKICR